MDPRAGLQNQKAHATNTSGRTPLGAGPGRGGALGQRARERAWGLTIRCVWTRVKGGPRWENNVSAATAMLGLDGPIVLAVSAEAGELEQAIETTAVEDFCRGFGVQA